MEVNMELETLKGLSSLKAEIRSITREIENFPQGIVSDYAYSYPNGVKKVIPLVGYADCSHIRKRLQIKLDELQDRLEEMEDWLDTLEDCELAAIVRMKYRNGLTLEQIGDELGYDRSTVGKKVKQFERSFPHFPSE